MAIEAGIKIRIRIKIKIKMRTLPEFSTGDESLVGKTIRHPAAEIGWCEAMILQT